MIVLQLCPQHHSTSHQPSFTSMNIYPLFLFLKSSQPYLSNFVFLSPSCPANVLISNSVRPAHSQLKPEHFQLDRLSFHQCHPLQSILVNLPFHSRSHPSITNYPPHSSPPACMLFFTSFVHGYLHSTAFTTSVSRYFTVTLVSLSFTNMYSVLLLPRFIPLLSRLFSTCYMSCTTRAYFSASPDFFMLYHRSSLGILYAFCRSSKTQWSAFWPSPSTLSKKAAHLLCSFSAWSCTAGRWWSPLLIT